MKIMKHVRFGTDYRASEIEIFWGLKVENMENQELNKIFKVRH